MELFTPPEAAIERVMRDLPGTGRMQAINHLRGRRAALDAAQRNRTATLRFVR